MFFDLLKSMSLFKLAYNYVRTNDIGNNMPFNYYSAYTFPLIDMTTWNEQPYTTEENLKSSSGIFNNCEKSSAFCKQDRIRCKR